MNPDPARYSRPSALDAALASLATAPRVVLAGGTDLYASGTAMPSALRGPVLDITAIDALRGIRFEAREVVLGGAATWADIRDARLPAWLRCLQDAAGQVGARQIQQVGTVAGNLCNASPAADGIPPLLSLAAVVDLAAARGARSIALEDFVQGPRRTARAADELLTAVRLPLRSPAARSVFLKLGARSHLVISIVSLALCVDFDAHGRIVYAGIAVGSCAATARRLASVESRLLGLERAAARRLVVETVPEIAPIDDIRGTSAYRRDALCELLRRGLGAVCED